MDEADDLTPYAMHLKMATRCVAPPKWRPPPTPTHPLRRQDGTCLRRGRPPGPLEQNPRAQKLRPPHSPTASFSPGEQPGEQQLHLCWRWPTLIPSLHAATQQQSSCWQPPSASAPALMTFINEPHSSWVLMKPGDSDPGKDPLRRLKHCLYTSTSRFTVFDFQCHADCEATVYRCAPDRSVPAALMPDSFATLLPDCSADLCQPPPPYLPTYLPFTHTGAR